MKRKKISTFSKDFSLILNGLFCTEFLWESADRVLNYLKNKLLCRNSAGKSEWESNRMETEMSLKFSKNILSEWNEEKKQI